MALIDCHRCRLPHEIDIDPERPVASVECPCGADLTSEANACQAIVAALLGASPDTDPASGGPAQ